MEKISQIVNRVLAQADPRAPTTPTPRALSILLSEPLQAFETLEDPILEKMKHEAQEFLIDISAKQKPRWLSYCGISGTGKTFLAKRIRTAANRIPHMINHDKLLNPVMFQFWPDLLGHLRYQEFWRMDDIAEANLVVFDEIAIDHDPSGFAADKLCQMLSRRVGKWTLITSNWTLSRIQEIDPRIASRMVRDKSVVVGCDTVDYATRNYRKPYKD